MNNAIRFPGSNVKQLEKAERDRRDAEAYREMESDLRDLVHMGKMSAMLTSGADGEPPTSEPRSLATFAVYHLEEMLLRFEMKYDDGDWKRRHRTHRKRDRQRLMTHRKRLNR